MLIKVWFPTFAQITVGRGIYERVIGIEPTSSAWKADALTVVLYPQISVAKPLVWTNFPQTTRVLWVLFSILSLLNG